MEIRIPVSVTSDWRVTGTSKPSQVEYNITAPKVDKYIVEDQIGKNNNPIFNLYDTERFMDLGKLNFMMVVRS